MNIDKLTRKAYSVCEWFAKIVILNLLWIGFTLCGLIVFGIMPATVALFTVVRKWTLSETDIPIFKTFTQTYKQEFFRSNYLGLFLMLMGTFLFYDLKLIMALEGAIVVILGVPVLLIISCYLLIFIYFFPVYVHFNLRAIEYFKYAFIIGFFNLHITISIIILLVVLCSLLVFLPGFIPFSSVSVISIIIMFRAKSAFKRIENKQEKYNVQN